MVECLQVRFCMCGVPVEGDCDVAQHVLCSDKATVIHPAANLTGKFVAVSREHPILCACARPEYLPQNVCIAAINSPTVEVQLAPDCFLRLQPIETSEDVRVVNLNSPHYRQRV